ncbi:MAG: hypothetical protein QOD99_2321 [Chthoniobacter sp.]|nr:hypothetical protein [Chthoniobacter sp.]
MRRLRRHFARHNRRVIGLALATAVAALAFWGLIYLVLYWLLLLAISVAHPANAHIPLNFTHIFFASALVLCALGWVGQRLAPNEMPRDKKSPFEIALDFFLAVPRMTLAIWGNLRALQFLTNHECRLAQRLLEAIASTERFGFHQVPLEIPDERTREKILLALQISELIEIRQRAGELLIALHGAEALALSQNLVRLRAR